MVKWTLTATVLRRMPKAGGISEGVKWILAIQVQQKTSMAGGIFGMVKLILLIMEKSYGIIEYI